MNPSRVAVGCLFSILGLAAFQALPSSPAKPAEDDWKSRSMYTIETTDA